jgi:hypothetical protein
MKNLYRAFFVSLIALTALFAAACPARQSIADIEANPSKYNNRDTAIAGVVIDSYGLNIPGTNVRGGAYKVDDGTGTIWVITENAVPSRGTQVGVSGTVGSGVNYHGKNYGLGIYEKDRRIRRGK